MGVVVRYFHLGGLEFDFAAVETRAVQAHRVAHELGAGLAGECLDYTGDLSHSLLERLISGITRIIPLWSLEFPKLRPFAPQGGILWANGQPLFRSPPV